MNGRYTKSCSGRFVPLKSGWSSSAFVFALNAALRQAATSAEKKRLEALANDTAAPAERLGCVCPTACWFGCWNARSSAARHPSGTHSVPEHAVAFPVLERELLRVAVHSVASIWWRPLDAQPLNLQVVALKPPFTAFASNFLWTFFNFSSSNCALCSAHVAAPYALPSGIQFVRFLNVTKQLICSNLELLSIQCA